MTSDETAMIPGGKHSERSGELRTMYTVCRVWNGMGFMISSLSYASYPKA